MRNFFVNLTNQSANRETSAPIPSKSDLFNEMLVIPFLFIVNEQNSINPTNDYPSSSYESDVSASPPSNYTASPTLNTTTAATTTTMNDSSQTTNSAVFIKHFVFSPGCHIRIDYRGKLRKEQLFESGPLLNLIIGLAQLSRVDIYLQRISYKRGLKGYDKLLAFLIEEWLKDKGLTDVIRGIAPLSSISQIAVGIKDLFYLPFCQYHRDGRFMRGLGLGASSFTTNTALALIELSGQVVRCAHFAALLCFELVSPSADSASDGSMRSSSSTQAIMSRNHPPPNDIREGVTHAVNVIQRGFNSTSHQLRIEAQSGRRRSGLFGVISALIRQMPSVAIQPIVTTTKAVDSVLVGVRNHFNPDERHDDKEKYRND